MTLDRKTFLRRTVAGSLGLLGALGLRAEAAAPDSSLPAFSADDPERFWAAVRAQYPLSRDITYFNTGGLGPTCSPALAAAAAVTARLQQRSEHGHELFAGARTTLAKFLGADPEEIAFVRNATEGNGIIAAGLALKAGDEVIFETHAHPGGSFPWLNEQARRGIGVKLFEPDPEDAAGNVARIADLMTARTRVVQVSHVTAPTGIVMPVAAIGRLCRERNCWFHIDGAQSAGMFPFLLRDLPCDSFATSGHKWLGGPLETGVLFIRRQRIAEVAPPLVGAYSGELEQLPGELRLSPTALRYEYGTRNSAAVVGLAEAVRFQERIGRERIAARGRALTERVRAGLASLPGIEVLTPSAPELSAAMLTFRSATVPFDRLFQRLVKEHAIRCRPVSEQKLNALRVATHCFNSPAECDALVAAVRGIVRSA